MIYIKSTLIGLLTLFTATILYIIIATAVFLRKYPPLSDGPRCGLHLAMPTREELHKLIDSMPEGAMETAHRSLSHLQLWPPPPPPEAAEMRKRMEERRLEWRQRQRPGTIGLFGGT